MEDWRARYLRKVLDFVGAPEGVDLDTVVAQAENNEGYRYSSYTFEDPSFRFYVTYVSPIDDGWIKAGQAVYRSLEGDEVAKLIGSFDA